MNVFRSALVSTVVVIALVVSGTSALALGAPVTVMTGLVGPHDLSTDRQGRIHVAQQPTLERATLSRLSRDFAPTELFRVDASAGRLNPQILSTAFDFAGNAYFSVLTQASLTLPTTGRSAIVRLDRTTGTAIELFAAEAPSPVGGGPGTFIAVNGAGTVYFARANEVLSISPGSPAPSAVASFPTTSSVRGELALDLFGNLAAIVNDGTDSSIYIIRAGAAPRHLATLRGTSPAASGFIYVGFDVMGNLYSARRLLSGFVRFTCADSTKFSILRIDRQDVRAGTDVAPRIIAELVVSDMGGLVGGSPTFFRVSALGDVYVGLYPFVRSCPPEPFPTVPIRVTAAKIFGVQNGPGGYTTQLLIDEPAPASGLFGGLFGAFFTLAVDLRQDLYVASPTDGTLRRFRRF